MIATSPPRTAVIMQPTYLPYLGYFQLMAAASVFVCLDDVQFARRSWQSRNRILTAQGEGRAIETVFQAIHDGNPDQKLLSYQYLQTLPKIAAGNNASTWIIPAEVTAALSTIGNVVGSIPVDGGGSLKRVDLDEPIVDTAAAPAETSSAVEEAIKAAQQAESPVPPSEDPPA